MTKFACRSNIFGAVRSGWRTVRFNPASVARKGLATFLSALLAFQPVLVHAQVAPDVNAPIANQPGVGTAPNGVPLVDIVTPNGQGLSHNKYHDFNVGTPGLILNNLNAEVGTSQLGGVTPGNPNLVGSGPATVILNEVTSGSRSSLWGAVEVFGARADVIVANPNGISCSGCGFINTPRATLTTGVPEIDASGRLGGFTVQGGDVTFGANGGNFAAGNGAVDLFDIVSRRVQIDGPVSGKNLRLSVGRQKFDYATGETTPLDGADDAPEFAIDGSALGAMQADRIKIVVTDKGAGVRMRGDMAANAGDLMLSADGKISLGNVSGRDGVSIKSKRKNVEAKKVTSKKKVTVKADKGIAIQSVAADEDIILNAGTGLLSIAGDTAALGVIEMTTAGAIAAGNVAAGRNASLQAGQGIVAGSVNADAAASLSTSYGNIALSGTARAGGGDLVLEAASGSITGTSLISFNNMTLTAGQDIVLGDAILSGGRLDASASTIRAGNITSYGAVNLAGTTTVNGQLLSGSDIVITGPSITLGTAFAGVDVSALKEGNVIPGQNGDLTLIASLSDVMAGRLISAGNMAVTAKGDVTANTLSYGNLDLTTGNLLTLTGQSLAGGNASLNAGSITIDTLVSGVDFAATGQSGGSLILNTGPASAGQMTITANNASITADQLISGGNLTARARQDLVYNSLQSFAAADLTSLLGTISLDRNTVAKGNLTLTLNNLDLSNDRGKLATAGTLIVHANDANLAHSTLTFGGIALNLTGSVDASGTRLNAVTADGGSGDIAITAQTIHTNAATTILAANDLTLTLASLANAGQLAANNDLIFNIAGNLTNSPTGLIYAGHDGRLYVAGDLLNDQGAILIGNDLTIAADANGGRNASLTNVSGLIQAGRDASIITANLTNKRLSIPTWSDVVVSADDIIKFILNPDTWGEPLGALFVDPATGLLLDAYGDDVERATTAEWMSQLFGIITLADGTSYRTRAFIYGDDNTPWDYIGNYHSAASMLAALKSFYPTDADGNIILTPDLISKMILIVNRDDPYAEGHVWDDNTQMRQTIHEQQFDVALSPEALIRTGRNLTIDATVINNEYSSIEAGGDAKLTGSVLNNEGVALYRTVTSTCEATGGCEAYDANGNRDGVNDLDNGNSRVTSQTIVAGAYGNIKAAGNLDISGFATVNNTSADGSIAGGAALSSGPVTGDPTSVLDGMTAGGALYTPNAALGSGLTGSDLLAALSGSAPKPDSGGFGGTIPGQVFLYETRAEFLDVGRFYGSGYFINRIGYNPDRAVPFLGDAYFENQLIDQQLRALINQGLGRGSFIPGSDAIEQMKTLLDRGADFASANGLTIGEKLSPELIASLTETLVWYETKTVNGVEVLVPTVYIADADKANLTVAGAILSGGSLTMNVGDVNNSGLITAKTDLTLVATNITATGGSFTAGNDVSLSASQNLTIQAADMQIGGETFVKAGSGVTAGGNASLAAGNDLTLTGAEVKAGNDVSLTGENVTLGTAKATNNGSDTVIGTSVQSGGDTTIVATDTVTVIGSSVAAGGNLSVEAKNGSVNIVAAEVDKKVNGGGNHMSQTDNTFALQSSLSSGGDTSIKAGDDILIAGSKIKAEGDISLETADDITITTARETTETIGREVQSGSQTHLGSEISAGGSVTIKAGDKADADNPHDLTIIGSKIEAGDKIALSATDDVVIAEARDSSYLEVNTSSDRLFGSAETHSRTDTATSVVSSLTAGGDVSISSGNDAVLVGTEIDSGGSVFIGAGGDVVMAAAQDVFQHSSSSSDSGLLSSESESHSYLDVTNKGVTINAGKDISVISIGGDIVTAGTQLETAEGDINLLAVTGDIYAGSYTDIHAESHKQETSYLGGLLGSTDISNSTTQISTGTAALSGLDLSLVSGQDTTLIGSQLSAGGNLNIVTGGDLNVLAAIDSERKEKFTQDLGLILMTTITEQSYKEVTNLVSMIAGGQLSIDVGGNTNVGIYDYEGKPGQNPADLYPKELLDQQALNIIKQILADDYAYDKETQLSPAFKAVLTIVVGTVVMPGLGLGNLLGLGANSWQLAAADAFTSSLIVNSLDAAVSGNFDLGETLAAAAFSGITAGLTAGIDLGTLGFDTSKLSQNLIQGFGNGNLTLAGFLETALDGVIQSGLSSAFYGSDFASGVLASLVSYVADGVAGAGIWEVSGLTDHGSFSIEKLVAKAALNCLAAEAKGASCASGAMGSLVTELIVTSGFTLGTDQYNFAEYRNRLKLAAAIAGYFTSGGKAENVFATADAAVIDYNNNAVPLLVWGIIALAGYTTYEGGGNPVEGLRVIGRGEDLVQALAAAGLSQAIAFSSENFPAETKAFLDAAAAVGVLADMAITYVDEATGKVVSTNWNKLPPETQDLIKGGAIVASFVIPSGTAAKIASKLPDMPKVPDLSDLTGHSLIAHENWGGHTIAKHVGKSDADLATRLASDFDLKYASAFPDVDTASLSIADTIVNNMNVISNWLDGSDSKVEISFTSNNSVGSVMQRGMNNSVSTNTTTVILTRDPLSKSGYTILTSYPSL